MQGGGIYVVSFKLEVLADGSAVFSQNKAGTAGGGVFDMAVRFTVSGQASFTNNSASFGAGIALLGDSSLNVVGGNVTISGNIASINGGGIHADGSTQFVVERTTFLANSAGTTGGAISLLSVGTSTTATAISDQAIISKCQFDRYEAGDAGGAMFVAGGFVIITNSNFDGNTAGRANPTGNYGWGHT